MHDSPRKADDVLGDTEARDRGYYAPIDDPHFYHYLEQILYHPSDLYTQKL